jgi:hypothetical protein
MKSKLKLQQQRKFFTMLPVLVIPFLVITFYALGGGGVRDQENKPEMINGFNINLPPAIIDRKEDKMDKLAFYARADADSARRKEQMQLDPYHHKMVFVQAPVKAKPDTTADRLLRKLDLFKMQVNREEEEKTRSAKKPVPYELVRQDPPSPRARSLDTSNGDPELDRLNEMLDKIARLQGVEHTKLSSDPITPPVKETRDDKEVSVAIPAAVEGKQELMNGAVLALRLTSAISYHGMMIPKDQPVYGMVSFSGDRLQVSIHSIRYGSSIISTAWQVYDMDGLQGLRVPDGMGRQVARQSADQGVGGLNIMSYDPSIGGQLAGAGVQVARNFFGRKIRTLRATVPAGYQVLLRDTKMNEGVRLLPDSVFRLMRDSLGPAAPKIIAPPVDSFRPYLHVSTKEGGTKLTLRGIYVRDSLMWLFMQLKDDGSFGFVPDHFRCSIRPNKHWKRMTMQELPLVIACDSVSSLASAMSNEEVILLGLKPFAIERDKRLVVVVEDSHGGKTLELNVPAKLVNEMNSGK